MMEYKRFTDKDWHKEKFYPKTDSERVIRKRLWDLENEIENGTLKKIPENAVVLTREEHIQMLKDLANSNEIAYLSGYGKGSKETAEKFAKMVDETIAKRQGERDGYEAFTIDDKAKYDGDIVSLALFEICKEITEG